MSLSPEERQRLRKKFVEYKATGNRATRNELIEAVTLADAKRVAKRLFGSEFLVTVVGRPKGLNSKTGG